MKVIAIGKGLCRTTVRSKAKRERLARISEVEIFGNRVIFPERLIRSISAILDSTKKKKQPEHDQTELF